MDEPDAVAAMMDCYASLDRISWDDAVDGLISDTKQVIYRAAQEFEALVRERDRMRPVVEMAADYIAITTSVDGRGWSERSAYYAFRLIVENYRAATAPPDKEGE